MVESKPLGKGMPLSTNPLIVGPIGETPKLRVINSFSKEKVNTFKNDKKMVGSVCSQTSRLKLGHVVHVRSHGV